MIEKLRVKDANTFTAVGPKFDFGRVLARSRRLLTLLVGRSTMRFQGNPPPTYERNDGGPDRLDEAAFDFLSDLLTELHRVFDASDHSVTLFFGPFYVAWAPLGLSALCGPLGNCLTVFDEDWSEMDPTPCILIRGRQPPHEPLGREQTAFLADILRAEGHDIEPIFLPDEVNADAVIIRFPHDAFGAGRDRIRICRYAHKDAEEIGGPA